MSLKMLIQIGWGCFHGIYVPLLIFRYLLHGAYHRLLSNRSILGVESLASV
jgi:hypothetical protein